MDIGSLTQKKGPLPVWAWALITAGVLYLLYRHFKGSGTSAAATPAATATDTTGTSVASPSTGFASGPVDTSGNGVTAVNPPGSGVGDNTQLPWWADPTQWPLAPVPPLGSGNPTDPGTVDGTPVSPSTPAVTVARTTKPALKSIIPGITGTIKSQKVLPSGAKLVTLSSGKQIEQAKGKKAYVVKKGK